MEPVVFRDQIVQHRKSSFYQLVELDDFIKKMMLKDLRQLKIIYLKTQESIIETMFSKIFFINFSISDLLPKPLVDFVVFLMKLLEINRIFFAHIFSFKKFFNR